MKNMKAKLKCKMLIWALFLAVCMTFIPGAKCNAAGTKNITIRVGEEKTVKAGKKLSKSAKTKNIKWKVTQGKKNIKLSAAKNKRSAMITGKKIGRSLVTLSYKGKKKQQYLITILGKKNTDADKEDDKKKDEEDEEEYYNKKKWRAKEPVPLTGISVAAPDHALDWNERYTPTITKIPEDADAGAGYAWTYIYSSADEKVVKVSDEGHTLTAVGVGQTTITVKVYQYGVGGNTDPALVDTGIYTTFNLTVSYEEYKAKYHYQIFPIHPEFTPTNDATYFYYLKTDNPDGTAMAWNVEGPEGGQNKPKLVKGGLLRDVLDLGVEIEHGTTSYGTEYDSYTNKVPGGYIISISYGEMDMTSKDKTGTFKFNIFEKNVEKLGTETGDTEDPRDYGKAYEYSIEVIDGATAFDREADRIVKEVYEKINEERYRSVAVCCRNTSYEGAVYSDKEENREFWIKCGIAAWLIHDEYSYGSGLESGTTSDLVANTWYSKDVTCWGASTLMCKVAEKLGAEKVYYYYTKSRGHRNARVVYNGEIVDFNATPLIGKYNYISVEGGVENYVTYEMVDYSDPRFKADWE